MPSEDPTVRSLVGRVAAYSRLAGSPPKPEAPDSVIPEGSREAYLHEVDPTGSLPLPMRQRRAAAAYKRDVAVQALRAYRSGATGGDAA